VGGTVVATTGLVLVKESAMANEKQIKELKEKVAALVQNKFGGDWYRGFTYYAAKNGGSSAVEKEDLLVLLEDAGIGSWITRGAWADGILDAADKNKDKTISWEEFEALLQGSDGKK
jgi:hypothetical protein